MNNSESTDLDQTDIDESLSIDDLLPEPAMQSDLPRPMESPSFELPPDPESQDFALAIQALRPLFEARTAFNFMVCDQLAMRGVAPHGLNVRTAGKWGNPNAVAADVKAWYAGLSARLSAEHAKIPEAVKRGANSLLEQMWELLTQAVTEPAQVRFAELSQELLTSKAETAKAIGRIQTVELAAERDRAQAVEASEALNQKLAGALASAESLESKVKELTRSISEAALAHQQELNSVARKYEEQLLRERHAHQDEQRRSADDLASANQMVRTEREHRDAAGRDYALAVDRFRQDVKEANQRADAAALATAQAKGQIEALKDQNSQLQIDRARADQAAMGQVNTLEKLANDLKAQMAQLEQKFATSVRQVEDQAAEIRSKDAEILRLTRLSASGKS